MRKCLPTDGDLEIAQVGEIGLAQLPRTVLLGEIHFLRWSSRRPPVFYLALKRPQLSLGESLGILPLQFSKNRLGLQARVPVQLLFNLRPDVLELILPRAPVTFHLHLAGQSSRPQV